MAEETRTLEDLKELQPEAPPAEIEKPEPKIDPQGRAYATGKRKGAIARVWIKPGAGKITVNKRDHHERVVKKAVERERNPCCASSGRSGYRR